MIVVDVTVVTHLLIRGSETDAVVDLYRRDPHWVAPVLWRSELLNVLWKYIRKGDVTLDLALEHFALAEKLLGAGTFDVHPPDVLSLAVKSGCSAYDCPYVALAERLDVPLVTHDRQVLRAFPGRATVPKNAA